jgi:membrane-associated phospholipid phosphatase
MSARNPAQPSALTPSFALPLFIGKENKFFAGALLFVIASTLYLTSNHLHFLPPQLLPMSWVDLATPFWPNTVWIYLSEYFYFIIIYALIQDGLNLNKYWWAFFGLQLVSVGIFLAWPTTYPRDQFPLPNDMNAITHYAFASLRETDTPANCCPSLHVSSVYLASFLFINEQRKRLPFFFIWGSLIALSTLTTKQHYLVDVVTGFMMAVLFYWLFYRRIPYRQVRN